MADKTSTLVRRAGTVLLVLLAATLWYRFLFVGGSAQSAEPTLEIDPKSLAFGPVQFVPKYAHTISLRNLTEHEVEVTEFLTSCSCVEVSPASLTIPAHGKASVVMTLDMKRFVTPGIEPAISGEVEFTPVVSGRAMPKSMLAFEFLRPRLLALSPDVDFGTLYGFEHGVDSNNILFATDDLKLENISLQTAAPYVERIYLTPLEDRTKYYKRYRIFSVFTPKHESLGLNTFVLTITDTAGQSLQVPCRVRFDSGLRLRVANRPPRILTLGRQVIWQVDVYQVGGSLTEVVAATGDPSQEASRVIDPEQLVDGSWRLTCRLTPHRRGNIKFPLRLSARQASGERSSVDHKFHFYVPFTSKGK